MDSSLMTSLFMLHGRNARNGRADRSKRLLQAPCDGRQLAPDCILPMQYFDQVQKRFSAVAEGRLLLAVLQDAINCYLEDVNCTGRHARARFREVNDWFNARNCHDLFAFESICEVFGIDPPSVRRALRRMGAYGRPQRPGRHLTKVCMPRIGRHVQA